MRSPDACSRRSVKYRSRSRQRQVRNHMPDEERFNRRRFFREGLREMLKPLSRAVEPMQRAIEQFETISAKPEAPRKPDQLPAVWIRPPGALFPDQSFRDTCSKCRKCIEVCPANCI